MRDLPGQHLLSTVLTTAFGAALVACSLPLAAQMSAQAAERSFDLKLPAQSLATALNELSRQTGTALFAAGDLVAGQTSRAVSGRMTVEQALRSMLADAPLEAARTVNGGFAIRHARAPRATQSTLPAVTVTAQEQREAPDGPVHGFVARRSATGSKSDTPITEIPQSLSVLSRTELEARGSTTMAEVMRYVPGLTTDLYGQDDRPWEWVALRGFEDYYHFRYLDGLRIPAVSNTAAYTEPYGLERVEILRGPSSGLYGQATVGGIINKVSKRPQRDATREISVQVGSFDRKQLSFDIGGAIGDEHKLLYRLVGLGLDSNAQVSYPSGPKQTNDRQYFAPSLTWQMSPDTSLTILADYLKSKGNGNTAEYVDPQGRHTGILFGEPSYNAFEPRQWNLGYQFEHRFSDAWNFKQNFRTSETKLYGYTGLYSGEPNSETGIVDRAAFLSNEKIQYTVVDSQFHGNVDAAGVKHALLLGVDLVRARYDIAFSVGAGLGLNVNAPVYGVAVTPLTAADLSSNYLANERQLGIYLQDQMKFGSNWMLTLGGRHDRLNSDQNDRLTGLRTDQHDKATTGRAAITYLSPFGVAPYISYSESFVPVAGLGPDGTPFKPSRGKQYELGVKYQSADGGALLTAAVYDLTKTNILTTNQVTFVSEQRGEARSRGLELEAKLSLTRGLDVSAQYTFTDIVITRDSDPSLIGKRPTGIPEHAASAWIDHTFQGGDWHGFGVGFGARYVGERFADGSNTVTNKAVTLVDAAVRYTFGPWRLALNISNVFDRKQNVRTYSVGVPNIRRSATASATYRF